MCSQGYHELEGVRQWKLIDISQNDEGSAKGKKKFETFGLRASNFKPHDTLSSSPQPLVARAGWIPLVGFVLVLAARLVDPVLSAGVDDVYPLRNVDTLRIDYSRVESSPVPTAENSTAGAVTVCAPLQDSRDKDHRYRPLDLLSRPHRRSYSQALGNL